MRLLTLAVLLTPLLATGIPAAAQTPIPKPVETAVIGPALVHIPGLGDVEGTLSASDTELYRRIFEVQQDGDWKQADKLIHRVRDRRLMGHVLAQRYLHPTKYRSAYKELRAWMARYADHPQARRIHRLAVLRQPKKTRGPQAPVIHRLGQNEAFELASSVERPARSRAATSAGRRLQAEIRSRVRRGWPTGARELALQSNARRLLNREQLGQAWRDIAQGYYRAAKDAEALAAADSAAQVAGDRAPLAFWWGGLAAWRSGKITDAKRHFTALAEADGISDWTKSAGAYWAARATLVTGDPAAVNDLLALGAQYPRTFYGLLSARALGEEPHFDWHQPPLVLTGYHAIASNDFGQRAIGLLQTGQHREAELELLSLAAVQPHLVGDILALAGYANLPALAFKLAGHADPAVRNVALYPLPEWELDNGFAIDQALVFAFIRQESAFNVNAKSRAGARGLMQLMPRTASFIGRQRSLHGRQKHKLFDPELNLTLGQRYIGHLLADEAVSGNLFRLATAYNAGPGNLRKWERKISYSDDPLLFIESLPSRETRHFVERILTNLWIYRHRLGQPSPSLDDVVAGSWPNYRNLDQAEGQTANGAN